MSYAACNASAIDTFNRTGDPKTQKEWHSNYRDSMDNMYRTSYKDMIHGREVSVKNDFPAGYGGHVPSLRHDVLFRNTEFDRMRSLLKNDPGRDVLPSFVEQNLGIPSLTKNPKGIGQAPTAGSGPDVLVKPPWALTLTLRELPTFRTNPPNSARTVAENMRLNSARGNGNGRPVTTPGGTRNRVNQAAVKAGQLAFNLDRETPTPDRVDTAASNDPTATAVKAAVASANDRASKIATPSEAEVLVLAQKERNGSSSR